MATINTTRDDIKADVRELAAIALEDNISKDMIERYRTFHESRYQVKLEEILKYDLLVSNITGIRQVSSRFADKLLSVLSKYQSDEDRKLIFYCVYLMRDYYANVKGGLQFLHSC
jgi:hypothetical protein